MRRLAWVLLLFLAFAIPWEYALIFPEPFGDIARVTSIALLMTMVPSVLQKRSLQNSCTMFLLIGAFYLWWCVSYFWSIDQASTVARIRAYFQEMMITWFIWELVDHSERLRSLLRAYIAGSWVLALLTIASLIFTTSADQIRFVAPGHDPNDVARLLNIALPIAVLLLTTERRWRLRLMAAGYLPLAFAAVLLTGSRSGFVAAVVGAVGSVLLFSHRSLRQTIAAVGSLSVMVMALLILLPRETLERLGTIPAQLSGGDLNRRIDIWSAGWLAFAQAPFFGHGAGSFTAATGLAPEDTAHNTVLALAVDGGIVAVFIGVAIVLWALRAVAKTSQRLRIALGTSLTIWLLASVTATVQESRSTWLLFGFVTVAARLADEIPEASAATFSPANRNDHGSSALQPLEAD